MGQRTSFVLAAVLSGFLLVALGGVAGRVVDAGAAGPVSAATPVAAPTAELVAAMQQREAAYRQLIAEANARLQQMGTGPETQVSYPITPARALIIAASANGGSLVRPPEMVNVQGRVAYEVVLTSGTSYVDATTGRILTASAPPAIVTVVRASPGEHEDHEDGGDD